MPFTDVGKAVIKHYHIDKEKLKARIAQCREELQQAVINKVIDRFHPPLRICIEAEGKHFEHLM